MATIVHFEDLEAWKKAQELVRRIYAVSGEGALARDGPLRDQVRRAALSCLANIAEGFERDGRKEFIHALTIAKGSCGEVRAFLHAARSVGYLAPDVAQQLVALAEQTSRLLAGLIRYLRSCQMPGRKFLP